MNDSQLGQILGMFPRGGSNYDQFTQGQTTDAAQRILLEWLLKFAPGSSSPETNQEAYLNSPRTTPIGNMAGVGMGQSSTGMFSPRPSFGAARTQAQAYPQVGPGMMGNYAPRQGEYGLGDGERFMDQVNQIKLMLLFKALMGEQGRYQQPAPDPVQPPIR